jgi:sugar phosphate isomerase/epimerase
MNQIMVQGYTIRDYIKDESQIRETFGKLVRIGYRGVQMAIPATVAAERLKELFDEFGLRRPSSGSNLYAFLENPGKAISDACLFGTPLISVTTLPAEMRDAPDGFRRFARDLNRACELAAKEGCKLGYHNHALEFRSFGGITGMDILLAETDSRIEFILDTHWLAAGGVNPADWIRRVRGRMSLIHFKDYAIGSGPENIGHVAKEFAEVGQGNLDWHEIAKACRETGVAQFAVEQDTCRLDPFTSLEISYKFMKGLGL